MNSLNKQNKKNKVICGFSICFLGFSLIFLGFRGLGKLEGLIYRGGTQTPDLYKGSTVGILAKCPKSFILI